MSRQRLLSIYGTHTEAVFLAAFVASCLRGALPPVDLRAVCWNYHKRIYSKGSEQVQVCRVDLIVRRLPCHETSQHARREFESEVCGGRKSAISVDDEQKGWRTPRRRQRRRRRRQGCGWHRVNKTNLGTSHECCEWMKFGGGRSSEAESGQR
jgi:hypothetical protein